MPTDTAELVISCRATGTRQVNQFTDAVRNADEASGKLLKTVGNLFGASQMIRFGKQSAAAFQKQENASNALRASLLKLGMQNKAYQREMEAFSAEMSKQTIYGDEQITMLQSIGLNMGIGTDKIQEATKAAIGLSAAYGMNVNTAMMLVARASKGHTETLSRYGIVLDSTKSKEEQYADILKLGGSNMSLAAAQTRTLSGALAQAQNAFGDAKEKVGAQFAPAMKLGGEVLTGLSRAFSSAGEPAQRFIVLTGALTSGMIALKGIMGANAVLSAVAAKAGITASGEKQRATTQEIQLEKALQKEKLATIALELARGNVNSARSVLGAAQGAEAAAYKSGNLESMQTAAARVAEAKEQLAVYEKSLKKAEENALNASNAVRILNGELNSNMVVSQDRNALLQAQALAEARSEESAIKLSTAEQTLARARVQLAEVNARIRGAAYDWRKSVMSGSDSAESDYADLLFEKAQGKALSEQVQKAQEAVKALKMEFKSANAEVIHANEALSAFDAAQEKQKEYTDRLAENIAAQEARRRALKSGADVLAAQNAAEKAYSQALDAQTAKVRMMEAAEKKAQLAIRMGATAKEAAAVKAAYLAEQDRIAAMQSTVLGRAQMRIASTAKAAATAVKGLAASYLPMLVISGAIAGIDYLLTRSKKAAEAAAEIAGREADRAKMVLEQGDRQREADREKLRRWEELAAYNNRTKEEQEELVRLASELKDQYRGLPLPILEQNDALTDTKKLWEEIRETQRKAREEQLKYAAETARSRLRSENLKFREGDISILSKYADFWANLYSHIPGGKQIAEFGWNAIGVGTAGQKRNDFNAVLAMPYEQRLKILEQMRRGAAGRNDAEAEEKLARLIEMQKEAFRTEKALSDFRKGGSAAEQTDSNKKLRESSQLALDLQKSLQGKEWQVRFDFADPEQKTEMLKMKLRNLSNELSMYPQETARLDENRLKAYYKLREQEVELQKEIRSMQVRQEEELAAQVMDRLNQEKEAERSFFSSIADGFMKLRMTAQTAIESGSAEAMRLQSRQFLSAPETAIQKAAEKTSTTVEKIRDIAEAIRQSNLAQKDRLEQIKNALKTSSVSA